MKLGLYGGTFDPIHNGHLILARDAIEQLGLERLIFIPAILSPHKEHRMPAAPEVRVEMARVAIDHEARFEVDEIELRRPPPSFAIDTIRELKQRHPRADFSYLIGEDNVPELHTWRDIEQLKKLVQFVVLNRREGVTAHPFPTLARRLDISATEIRQRVARGQSIRYLVPDRVCDIIDAHQLYREAASTRKS